MFRLVRSTLPAARSACRRPVRGLVSVTPAALSPALIQGGRNYYDSASSHKHGVARWVSALLLTFACFGSHAAADSEATGEDEVPKTKTFKVFRKEEVSKHTSPENGGVWVTFQDGVYDITDFVANHPGGKERIMMAAGKSISEFWSKPEFRQHYRSPLALELLEEMRVGTLHPDDVQHDDGAVHFAKSEQDLKYSPKRVYDCIIIGSGVSGLQCATELMRTHGVAPEDLLVLEAADYVGGRVRQVSEFVRGVNIDVGAEFLHGSGTLLTKFAAEHNEPIEEIYCWAHGDGGPLEEPVGGGYGLYWVGDKEGKNKRLLRFDAKDEDFVRMNEVLWGLAKLNENDYSDMHSLHDYLSPMGFSEEMLMMAHGGFANTLCTNSKELSLKQCIKWCRMWHEEEGEDGDFMFKNSFKCLVDGLKKDVQIELNSPVVYIRTPVEGTSGGGCPECSSGGAAGGVDDGLVTMRTAHGTTYYAKQLVVTSSPHVLKSGVMTFQPPLSTDVQQALDSVQMHNIVKIVLKFTRPVWPKGVHGMIMTDRRFLVPEMWFRDCSQQAHAEEPAKAYAIGFTTADYAAKLAALPKDEVIRLVVGQLDEVFSKLEPQHMSPSGLKEADTEEVGSLPKPSDAFLGGMFWDWNPQHFPFIGGGYCSPRAGKAAYLAERLSKPYGRYVCFAGEATNLPGATSHAALESGVRAAGYVAKRLKSETK